MPELPFVQVLVETLRAQVVGRPVTGVAVLAPSLLKTVEPPLGSVAAVPPRRLAAARRRGKLLLLDLSGGLTLILHLKRDGRLLLAPSARRPARDVALVLRLDGGEEVRLVEPGPKKRAGLWVRPTAEAERLEPVAALGVEPLEAAFTPDVLNALLDRARTQAKRFLTTQAFLAGIGNAYADEILWEARCSPFAATATLDGAARRRLYGAVRTVLDRAVEAHRRRFAGTWPQREPLDLLRVHRHAREPCPRCGTLLAAVYYAEHETTYCPTCQTGGKVYADRRLSRLLR